MGFTCERCGRYTIEQPCYDCLKQELTAVKGLVDQNLVDEAKRYRTLYEMAVKTCDVCRENCAIRRRQAVDTEE